MRNANITKEMFNDLTESKTESITEKTVNSNIRQLTIAAIQENIVRCIFNTRDFERDGNYFMLTAHPNDVHLLQKQFVSILPEVQFFKGALRDFKMMGFTIFVARSLDIKEGEWVVSVGNNFNS